MMVTKNMQIVLPAYNLLSSVILTSKTYII